MQTRSWVAVLQSRHFGAKTIVANRLLIEPTLKTKTYYIVTWGPHLSVSLLRMNKRETK